MAEHSYCNVSPEYFPILSQFAVCCLSNTDVSSFVYDNPWWIFFYESIAAFWMQVWYQHPSYPLERDFLQQFNFTLDEGLLPLPFIWNLLLRIRHNDRLSLGKTIKEPFSPHHLQAAYNVVRLSLISLWLSLFQTEESWYQQISSSIPSWFSLGLS